MITVANQKGGAGKTTTCMSLAAVTADANGPSIVVDADPQSSLAWWAECVDDLPFDFTQHTEPTDLRKMTDYDMIFVDCPGSLEGDDVLAELVANSHYVVLPTEPEALAFLPLRRTAEFVTEHGKPYRALLNKVDTRRGSGRAEATRSAIDEAGLWRFNSYVRHDPAHGQAAWEGRLITHYRGERYLRAREDFRRVHTELLMDLGRQSKGS